MSSADGQLQEKSDHVQMIFHFLSFIFVNRVEQTCIAGCQLFLVIFFNTALFMLE